jgi:hypothetical protein
MRRKGRKQTETDITTSKYLPLGPSGDANRSDVSISVGAFAVLWAVPGLHGLENRSLLPTLEEKGNDSARILVVGAAIGVGRLVLEADPAQCSPSAGHHGLGM